MKNTLEAITLSQYLEKWFNTSTARMRNKGIQVEINFIQFYNEVIKPNQLNTMQKLLDEGKLSGRQNQANPFAYVITWKSYSARSSNVFNVMTASFCTRQASKQQNLPKRGDVLRPADREAKSKAALGKKKSVEHSKNISKGLTGTEQSAQHKANRSASLKAYWAAKRNAK